MSCSITSLQRDLSSNTQDHPGKSYLLPVPSTLDLRNRNFFNSSSRSKYLWHLLAGKASSCIPPRVQGQETRYISRLSPFSLIAVLCGIFLIVLSVHRSVVVYLRKTSPSKFLCRNLLPSLDPVSRPTSWLSHQITSHRYSIIDQLFIPYCFENINTSSLLRWTHPDDFYALSTNRFHCARVILPSTVICAPTRSILPPSEVLQVNFPSTVHMYLFSPRADIPTPPVQSSAFIAW